MHAFKHMYTQNNAFLSTDDFAETVGIERIIEALKAHMWSNMVMKGISYRMFERNPISTLDDLFSCIANVTWSAVAQW